MPVCHQCLLSPLSTSAAEASAARATAGAEVLALALLRDPEALLQQEQLASLEVSRDVGRYRGDLGEI